MNQDFHFERLTTPDSVSRIGAYIDPNCRRKGVGSALLAKAFDFCREKGKRYIHVGFETANSNAINFWPKYFKPAIRSVRRTVNKDANSMG
jgi:GNAT superfamily N-acetyltransferase